MEYYYLEDIMVEIEFKRMERLAKEFNVKRR